MSAQPKRLDAESALSTRPELSPDTTSDRDGLVGRIAELAPWHMDIRITGDLSTSQAVSSPQNHGLAVMCMRDNFLERLDQIFPNGLEDIRMLDCACNAGGYCFWGAERNLKGAFGFDVREHWIRQARFVKAQRTVASTGQLRFEVGGFGDLDSWKLEPFELTLFKGIFSHLADPIAGIRKAAELTRQVMILNTPYVLGEPDGNLKFMKEDESLMAGVDGAKWIPTGPRVIVEILKWLGFAELKMVYCHETNAARKIGRMEIVAAREPGTLKHMPQEKI